MTGCSPGAVGTAGEIGHTIMQIDGPLCSCGRRGCAETFIGSRALSTDARIERAGQYLRCARPEPGRHVQSMHHRAGRQIMREQRSDRQCHPNTFRLCTACGRACTHCAVGQIQLASRCSGRCRTGLASIPAPHTCWCPRDGRKQCD